MSGNNLRSRRNARDERRVYASCGLAQSVSQSAVRLIFLAEARIACSLSSLYLVMSQASMSTVFNQNMTFVQAVFEFTIELQSFYNIDLFQRG